MSSGFWKTKGDNMSSADAVVLNPSNFIGRVCVILHIFDEN